MDSSTVTPLFPVTHPHPSFFRLPRQLPIRRRTIWGWSWLVLEGPYPLLFNIVFCFSVGPKFAVVVFKNYMFKRLTNTLLCVGEEIWWRFYCKVPFYEGLTLLSLISSGSLSVICLTTDYRVLRRTSTTLQLVSLLQPLLEKYRNNY